VGTSICNTAWHRSSGLKISINPLKKEIIYKELPPSFVHLNFNSYKSQLPENPRRFLGIDATKGKVQSKQVTTPSK
jgi:hypothetical protein